MSSFLFCGTIVSSTDEGRVMKYTLITPTGRVYQFYLLGAAQIWKQAYGGVLVDNTIVQEPKLEHGLIPPETVCPYKDICHAVTAGLCKHRGTEHKVPYSCGLARAFDIFSR